MSRDIEKVISELERWIDWMDEDAPVIALEALETLKERCRTGHWRERDRKNNLWACSECGEIIYSESEKDREMKHRYCEKCGARMGGGIVK